MSETEKGFQAAVIQFAHINGFRVAHFRTARTKTGWVTPVAADGKGFPDLVLVRERVIFAELKREGGKVSPDQRAWLSALQAAGVEAYLWKPNNWKHIEEVLTRR